MYSKRNDRKQAVKSCKRRGSKRNNSMALHLQHKKSVQNKSEESAWPTETKDCVILAPSLILSSFYNTVPIMFPLPCCS